MFYECQCNRLHLFLLFYIIVVDLNAENDSTTSRSNEISNEQRPKWTRLMQYTLKHEAGTTNSHHQESRQSDAIGIAGTDGINGLRQIAQNHRDTGHPTYFFTFITNTQAEAMRKLTPATNIIDD